MVHIDYETQKRLGTCPISCCTLYIHIQLIVRARTLQCILTSCLYIYIHMFIRLHAVDWIKLDLITKTLQLQDPEEICEAVFGGGQNQHFEAAGQSLGSLQLCDD